MMGAEEPEEHAPKPPAMRNSEPLTPTTIQIRRSNNIAVRCGIMDPLQAYLKLEIVADHFEAKAVMLEKDLMAAKGDQELDKAARG